SVYVLWMGNLAPAKEWKLAEIIEGTATNPYDVYRWAPVSCGLGCFIKRGLPLDFQALDFGNGVNSGAAVNNTGRWSAVTDIESDPESVPEVTLYYADDGDDGGILSAYSFELVGGEPDIRFLDDGDTNNSQYSLPHNPAGGGGYFWTPNEPTVQIVSNESIAGANQRLSFIICDVNPTVPVAVEFYFSGLGEPPSTKMTLTNPSAGALGTNNTIVNILPDGVTVYTVDWLTSMDGVIEGQMVKIVGRIIT
ncbi:MAG: hypothetical protein ACXABY_10025, partial [Candidatus Thorarchaeota archaeon]